MRATRGLDGCRNGGHERAEVYNLSIGRSRDGSSQICAGVRSAITACLTHRLMAPGVGPNRCDKFVIVSTRYCCHGCAKPTRSTFPVPSPTAPVCALCTGEKAGTNPTDRRKAGSKHHLLSDAPGIPLSLILTATNRNDVTQLLPLVDTLPPIAGKRGRPRRKPDLIQADRGYDSQPLRDTPAERGIDTLIARRNTEHGSGLGVTRWVIERTIAWLHQFRCRKSPELQPRSATRYAAGNSSHNSANVCAQMNACSCGIELLTWESAK